jgi:hypothetical protein
MTIAVDSIATDADLALELGGVARLNSAQPDITIRNAYRASALVDVLASLATRTPSLLEGDLSFPGELKQAVVYRALSKICFSAMTGGSSEDRNAALAKKYEADYQGAVRARFTASPGVTSPSGISFSFERR